jgi:DNA-directed RNA polymerase specialized sigma24 family protein
MHTEREIREFYAKWSPHVLALSCLLLGEGSEAERTAGEAFQAYLSRGLDLDVVQLPALLFVFALDAAKGAAAAMPPLMTRAQRLQEAVVLLLWKERSVFALRSAMRFDDMTIGEIAEIPVREVRKIWTSALFRLRELLHKDFFSGRKT